MDQHAKVYTSVPVVFPDITDEPGGISLTSVRMSKLRTR
jgi:hypothetical protein